MTKSVQHVALNGNRFKPLSVRRHLKGMRSAQATATNSCYDARMEKHGSDEKDLVRRAQAGNVRAFEALYRDNIGRIYALCLRMAGDAAEADELTQQAFVRAWEKLGSFRGDSAFSSWLHRLTVNVVLGSWRKRGRRQEQVVPFEALHEDDTDFPEPTAATTPTARGQRVDLERAIATLPDGARTVFVLYELEGYTHQEIAELTGLAVGTSKAQLHRAKQLLRKELV